MSLPLGPLPVEQGNRMPVRFDRDQFFGQYPQHDVPHPALAIRVGHPERQRGPAYDPGRAAKNDPGDGATPAVRIRRNRCLCRIASPRGLQFDAFGQFPLEDLPVERRGQVSRAERREIWLAHNGRWQGFRQQLA